MANRVCHSIPAAVFDGMKARMQRVIELNGDYIGNDFGPVLFSTAMEHYCSVCWCTYLVDNLC